jgi:prepilin-type processing-associated H-X9-DG protein
VKTQIELLIVIGVVGILGALLVPMLGRSGQNHIVPDFACQNNQKQLGLSFETWAGDNGDRFPMQVSTREGAMEMKMSSNVSVLFLVMSNELNTPRVLHCPADTKRRFATNFGSDFEDSKISYFVGVDAGRTNYTMALAGDRNLRTSSGPGLGIATVTSNTLVAWGPDLHKNSGYLLFVDGSVRKVKSEFLSEILSNGMATNHLLIP